MSSLFKRTGGEQKRIDAVVLPVYQRQRRPGDYCACIAGGRPPAVFVLKRHLLLGSIHHV